MIQATVQKWHRSALHDAMRNLGEDVPDTEPVDSQPQQHVGSAAAGADALERWSKAHQKPQTPNYRFPSAHADQMRVGL